MKQIREALSTVADTVGKSRGDIVARKSFFYKMGQTSQRFADKVNVALEKAGVSQRVVEHGTKEASFRGGQTVAQGSHFWVIVR
jgi:hypothetical protein